MPRDPKSTKTATTTATNQPGPGGAKGGGAKGGATSKGGSGKNAGGKSTKS